MRDRFGGRAGLAAVLLACLLVSGLLSACSASPLPAGGTVPGGLDQPRPPIPRVCVFETCRLHEGALEYAVLMPARWNGTLLLFTPGFYRVYPRPVGPPAVAPTSPRSTVTHTLLERGYALAGATYAWGGWSVSQSMRAAEAAYNFVSGKVGRPRRVYAWGQSMGGLTSVLLAQAHPDWVSGTASACGVLGGTTRFFDSALDIGYAVRTLLAPSLRIDRFGSYPQALAAFRLGHAAVNAALHGDLRQQALLVLIADLVHAPRGAHGGPPPDPRQRAGAAAQIIVSALGFATVTRWELEHAEGGAVSGNTGVDYSSRVDSTERAALDAMSPNIAEDALAALASRPRTRADQAARGRVDSQLDPSGGLSHPTVTLHDAQDQVAPLEHEGAFAALVAGTGHTADLMQLVTAPPPGWVDGQPAAYGVGHCQFSDDELIGLVTVLDDWVTSGVRPGPDAIRADFGTHNGLDLSYPIPAWPGAR